MEAFRSYCGAFAPTCKVSHNAPFSLQKSKRLHAVTDLDAYTIFGKRQPAAACVGENQDCRCVTFIVSSRKQTFGLGSQLLSSVSVWLKQTNAWMVNFPLLVAMSDSLDRPMKISLLKEPLVRRLSEVLDKSSGKGWRKLGEIVGNDRRFKVR